jgi:oligopeptide transport system ATP-binding protein
MNHSPTDQPILAVRDLKVHFPISGGLFHRQIGAVRAVDGVSFDIAPGETLGLVGESGCGKSTLGKAIVRLNDAKEGSIHFDGRDITRMGRGELRPLRREIQMIFQDPVESLNARHSVREIIEEPLVIHGLDSTASRRKRVDELLERVGLPASSADRYPFEFSGGQRQRIGIARAIALNPKLIVCDEPVSALDVSVQSQVLNLLLELQRDLKLSYLFIAHNLAVVKHISDRVAVMYLGKIVEMADADAIYYRPKHAYTKALLSAIPEPDPTLERKRILLEGDVPSPVDPPKGSAFGHRLKHPRYEETIGADLSLKEIEPRHWVAADPCCLEPEDWKKLGGK